MLKCMLHFTKQHIKICLPCCSHIYISKSNAFIMLLYFASVMRGHHQWIGAINYLAINYQDKSCRIYQLLLNS